MFYFFSLPYESTMNNINVALLSNLFLYHGRHYEYRAWPYNFFRHCKRCHTHSWNTFPMLFFALFLCHTKCRLGTQPCFGYSNEYSQVSISIFCTPEYSVVPSWCARLVQSCSTSCVGTIFWVHRWGVHSQYLNSLVCMKSKDKSCLFARGLYKRQVL